MVGGHHTLSGREFEEALGDGEGQGGWRVRGVTESGMAY